MLEDPYTEFSPQVHPIAASNMFQVDKAPTSQRPTYLTSIVQLGATILRRAFQTPPKRRAGGLDEKNIAVTAAPTQFAEKETLERKERQQSHNTRLLLPNT